MKRTNFKKSFLAIAILLSIASCKKDKEAEETPAPEFNALSGLYIANEGNFQSANSSITYFSTTNNNAITDIFKNINGHSPGDISQSMSRIDGKLYIVVNNSGKIEVCDLHSMKNIATITGFTSPRYILKVDSTKAYVSDLASNHISILNLNTNAVTSTIALNGWTEQMALVGNKVYVTNVSSEYLYVIDCSTDQLTDSILISKGATTMVTDINNKLWVICGSDYMGTYAGAIHRIDITNAAVEQSFTFPLPDYPSDICVNASKDSLYFMNTNIYKMSVTAGSLPSSAFITSNQNSFYSLSIDPSTNKVYVADAIDFIQNGRIYIYDSNGGLTTSFLAGIAPGEMLFY